MTFTATALLGAFTIDMERRERGAIVDTIVDFKPESPTYLQHVAVRLDEENACASVAARVPPGARADS